jgi:hypothetical protein
MRVGERSIAVDSIRMGNRPDAGTLTPTRRGAFARIASIAVCAPAMVIIVAGAALAQQSKPESTGPRGRAATRAAAPRKSTGSSDAAGQPASAGTLTALAPATLPGSGAIADAGLSEYKTLDGGTRVFKFTELDIEGQLKSPQLVYFLRRVRAEFAAGDLGHRSFMREMSETRKESSF